MDDPTQWWHDRRGATLWFLAVEGEEIAGFVLGGPDGYVSDLGVRPAWRGRGLGSALLGHAFDAFAARGTPAAALHVDTANLTGALRVYRRAGMRPEPAFTIWGVPL